MRGKPFSLSYTCSSTASGAHFRQGNANRYKEESHDVLSILNFTVTCIHDILSVSLWSEIEVIYKKDEDFSFFISFECAMYQPDFTKKV